MTTETYFPMIRSFTIQNRALLRDRNNKISDIFVVQS